MSTTLINTNVKYYVYMLIDPRDRLPFYVGKGSGNRAYQHQKFKDHNKNKHKDSKIKNILDSGQNVIVDLVHQHLDEATAYLLEEELILKIGIENLTNITLDSKPPSRTGRVVSAETRARRSAKLKGIPRTEEWRQNLSDSKKGSLNGMYGKKNTCTEERRVSIIRTKNLEHYELYKQALILLSTGNSASSVARELGIGKGPCCKLKNGSHMIFEAFPELCQFKTC